MEINRRDLFAGLAMHAILSNPELRAAAVADKPEDELKAISEQAWEVANAMVVSDNLNSLKSGPL